MIKMYQDLKETFWWQGMKKDVSSCLTCQKALKAQWNSTTFGHTGVEMG